MQDQALILVDLQNDFMHGGALAVVDGEATVAVANREIANFDLVIATQDWHPAGHMSFAASHLGSSFGDVVDLDGIDQVLWPTHCVQGTPGASFHSSLNVAGINAVVRKGTAPRVDSYSGFFDNGKRAETELHRVLQERGVKRLTVLGLATDYCVKFTVLDALELGYEVELLAQGCRGVEFSEGDVERALEEMRSRGASIK